MTQEPFLFPVEPLHASASTPKEVVKHITPSPLTPEHDAGIEDVYNWFLDQKNYKERFAQVFRKSIDEVLDGQRTGRYDLYIKKGEGRVEKTEKTYLGTKVEIVARVEFDLGYGHTMDYSINDHQVDAKFTMGSTWTIPKEAMGHICLLMRANDQNGTFQVGLIRISEENLNSGRNGDKKRTVSAAARREIKWIIENGDLPENLLLNLKREDPKKVESIFRASEGYKGSGNGGQLRTNELFRQMTGRLVDRTTVLTVATQHDGPKRARDARNHLRPEGIIVLGHRKPAPKIAKDLNLPIPKNGFWVSARIARVSEDDSRPTTMIDGIRYGIWKNGDEPNEAPVIKEVI
ncbi:NaeI family type II restriction endonuclease [Nocardiopsis sp. CA-288880]|uniref:NaeI family type II restriction endonuclease n=1 Tax=Nocardiopsis sp. CA-288880 TaxID=3239995 RepID=UPI003D999C8D